MTGTWYVSYRIPETMHYALNQIVKTDRELLADQSGALHIVGDRNSRVTEGKINIILLCTWYADL